MIFTFGWSGWKKRSLRAEQLLEETKEANEKIQDAAKSLLAQRDEARKDAYELGKQLTTATKKITELLEQVRLMSQR